MSRHRLAARDYKHGGARGGGFDPRRYQQFAVGLALGLMVALGLWLHEQRKCANCAVVAADAQAVMARADDVPAATEDDAEEQYEFYDMLPRFEVVVNEQERDVRRDQPSVTVERAGTYVLQVGSYRNLPDAERLRERLSRQGIDAQIQRVAVDADVWHRVRIGPYRDLSRLNAMREELRASDIDSLLIRVGD